LDNKTARYRVHIIYTMLKLQLHKQAKFAAKFAYNHHYGKKELSNAFYTVQRRYAVGQIWTCTWVYANCTADDHKLSHFATETQTINTSWSPTATRFLT